MRKRNIPDGPSLVALDAMRFMEGPQCLAPPVAQQPDIQPELKQEDYMGMMRSGLNELETVHDKKDPVQLLEFVYQTHTPKGPLPLLNQEFRSGNIKKHIRKALMCYHPNKQALYGDFGLGWVLLFNEITKFLTKCL